MAIWSKYIILWLIYNSIAVPYISNFRLNNMLCFKKLKGDVQIRSKSFNLSEAHVVRPKTKFFITLFISYNNLYSSVVLLLYIEKS